MGGGWVGGNIVSDRKTMVVTETSCNQMVDLEKSGTYFGANGGRLECGIVGTARNVVKYGNQFIGGVQESMFQEKVSKIVEAAYFQVSSVMDRRDSRYKQFNGVCGMAKRQRSKGGDSVVKVVPAERLVVADMMEGEGE
jgi:hypothetical protein